MFWIYFALLFVVLGFVCLFVANLVDYNTEDFWKKTATTMFVFAAIFIVSCLGRNFAAYSFQVSDNENLIKITQIESVYQKRADALTKEFARYLGETYPQHEKEIFDKMTPEEINIFLVKYPELQASKTIMELVKQIRSLQDDIYKQQISRAETLKDMRYRTKSKWVFQWMMPDIKIPEK